MATLLDGETKSTLSKNDQDDDDDQAFAFANLIVNSTGFFMALQAAIELGLLEIIAKAGPTKLVSAAEVAAQLPTKNVEAPIVVERILRLLATFSVLKCTTIDGGGGTTRLYGLAPVAKYLVRDEDGMSLGPYLAFLQDNVVLASWAKMKNAVLEGGVPFFKAHGLQVRHFEINSEDLRYNQVVNDAMANHSSIVMKKILKIYQGFKDVKVLVDVGGGLGHTLKIILSKYHNIKGINFDLPHVVQNGILYDGIDHVGGDMFESVPSGDAILLKWIIHGWGDEYCLKLLKNCCKAVPDNGKVIVIDGILPEEPEATTTGKCMALMDVLMLNLNVGAKERTYKEFVALSNAAGFTRVSLICNVGSLWVIEFHK